MISLAKKSRFNIKKNNKHGHGRLFDGKKPKAIIINAPIWVDPSQYFAQTKLVVDNIHELS
jgi:hypothetical protein